MSESIACLGIRIVVRGAEVYLLTPSPIVMHGPFPLSFLVERGGG